MADERAPATTPAGRPEDSAGDAPAAFAILRTELRGQRELLQSEIAALERVLLQRMDLADKAVRLQAEEYERRLDILNGERERERETARTFVPAAVFEGTQREVRQQVQQTSDKLIQFDGTLAGIRERLVALTSQNTSDKLIALTSDLSSIREQVAALRNGQEWLVRLIVGAVVSAIIALAFTWLRAAPAVPLR